MISRGIKKKINLTNFNNEKNNRLHLFTGSRIRDFIRGNSFSSLPSSAFEFLRRRWSEFSHVIHSSLFLLAFFHPLPLTFTADASKNEGHFLASRARCSLNPPNSSHLRPFSIATFATTPPDTEQRSFHLSTFIDSCVERWANDSSLLYSFSSYTFISNFTSEATIYHTRYEDILLNILYRYIRLYSFMDTFYKKREEIVYI